MKKAILNFASAANELSEAWYEKLSKKGYTKADETKYPFQEDFDELVFKIDDWAEAVAEILDHEELLEKFGSSKHAYVMSLNTAFTEAHWFLQARISSSNKNIVMIDETSVGSMFEVELKHFRNNFIFVDKTLYDLYMKLNSYGYSRELEEVIKLAKSIGGVIEDE